MKKILFLVFVLMSGYAMSQCTPQSAACYSFKKLVTDSSLRLAPDTLKSADVGSIARKGNIVYFKASTRWIIISNDSSVYATKNYVDSSIGANTPALNLQDVTDNGNTTTNSMEIIDNDFYISGGNMTFRSFGNLYSTTIENPLLTASRNLALPDSNGVITLSVNGNFADNKGNITISTGDSLNLEDVLTNGNSANNTIQVNQVKAFGSGGLSLNSNSGTQIANLGGGGGSNATFYGFTGYNSNLSGSYTSRSFTDKNYVDSVDALKQNLLTRPVTATANFVSDYLLRATGSTTADSSGIFQSGSNFGIGTTTPSDVFTIERNVSGNLYNSIRNNNTTNSSARFVTFNNSGNVFTMGMFSSTHSGTQYGYNVAGSAVYGANLAAGARVLFGTISNNDVVFGSNNVARIIIAAGGTVNIANLGTGTVYSNAGTLTNTNPSDERLKNNIEDIGYGLNEILKLKPKTFYYNSDSTKSSLKYGFIAQDVEKVMPTVVRKLEPDNPDSKLGLESDGIYVAMVKAIQQLEARVKELEAKLNAK